MTKSRQSGYYKAVRRVSSLISNTDKELHEILDGIVRSTARALTASASLLLLDSERKNLIHVSSWGLPKSFILKGILDPGKSLKEVETSKPVIISDVTSDDRVQYPETVNKSGIRSVMAVPILIDGKPAGSIRVYTREVYEFTNQDLNFVSTIANLTSMAIDNHILRDMTVQIRREADRVVNPSALSYARPAVFAHPSEKEFSQILDFYDIEWIYEPRSFPISWENDRITEMFTPDFYLPGLDLFIELTTMKQSLVTIKNRKVRRLQELHPDINITLLYKKDYDRLLAKFGYGPLAESRGRGVAKVLYSSAEIQNRVKELANQISAEYQGHNPVMVGVLRGVFCFMADLVRQITIPVVVDFMTISYFRSGTSSKAHVTKDINLSVEGKPVILVEDIVDTGLTLNYIIRHLKEKGVSDLAVCALFDKKARRIANVPLRYRGFTIPDEFIIGYGLDFKEEYRNLPFVGILGKNSESSLSRSGNEKNSK
ncbi:MAG TPA: hypoxanthine phosphoribosyltransferase [Dehalococcoidia bacterium]|nr:hypoxanthine phosphoribosyltransferase [Dehalococcoidia bacterium]